MFQHFKSDDDEGELNKREVLGRSVLTAKASFKAVGTYFSMSGRCRKPILGTPCEYFSPSFVILFELNVYSMLTLVL